MSAVSAFGAYKKNVAQKKAGAKKANGKPQPKNNKNAKATNGGGARKKADTRENGEQSGINHAEVDQLVEQLLGDSPSNPKKLSKGEQKKKKELEEYLLRQLEKDDNGDYDSEGDDDDDDDYSTGSDEFSDEYTLNSSSYTDFTDRTSGDDSELLNASADGDSTTNEADGEEFNLAALKSTKGATKRKQPAAEKPTSTAAGAKGKGKGNTNKTADNDAAKPKKARKGEEVKPTQQPAKAAADTKKGKTAAAKSNRPSLAAAAVDTAKATATAKSRKSAPGNIGNGNQQRVANEPIKQEPPSPPSNVIKMNSIAEGEKLFKWLIAPVDNFFAKYWEQNACLIQRDKPNYFAHLISFEAIGQMLLHNHIEFTKNIDITSYKNGVRETLNPEGRALPPTVWDHYGQGCSIRLLNPQTYLPGLFALNTTLQEYFHCMVGANAYLTPPNSQGFAPHYDDIEAFVLQIEGRKRWKLYKPRNQSEMLPRFSSPNFTQKDIGKPILEEVLKPGDVLYFPRGTIHQACTEPGYHSLHITLSVYQKQSYADLFERMMPLILQHAISSSVDMRRGLPLHTWRNAGIAFSDTDSKERADLLQTVSQLLTKSLKTAPLAKMMDAAVDQVAKKFQHEALPPNIHSAERVRTIFGSQSRTNERGEWDCDYDLELRTNVRLLRANVLRLVEEEKKIRIYYYLDNSKEYCEYEPNFIEIEPNEAASVEVLIKSYPQYVGISQLPLPDDERKVELATALWERGLLMTEKPFK